MKNQGYNLEHNYGHGANELVFNFYLLNMTAFFLHQLLEFRCEIYQKAREKIGPKYGFWEKLRSYVDLIIFDS